MAEGPRIVFQDDKGHTIRHLPGNRLQFLNYPNGRRFVLQVGFTQEIKNSTVSVVLLATGQLEYTDHESGATKITQVPVGAMKTKIFCKYCAKFAAKGCSFHSVK